MESNRRLFDRTVFMLLLLGRVVAVAAISVGNNENDLNLDCTNDYEDLMSCQLNGQICYEYNLTLQGYKNDSCSSFQRCDTGLCCCSVQMYPVIGETYTATVSRRGESLESKVIEVMETIKPRTPTITAVNKSNGNVEVFWSTNAKRLENLSAEVTYCRKGSTEINDCLSRLVNPPDVNGYKYCEISGQDLIPNTTYVVSVRSFTGWSGMFSDRSKEWEFTTDPAKPVDFTFMVIIISLSFAAAILTGIIYACSIKVKTKIWEPISKFPTPTLTNIYPSKSELWSPERTMISSVCVEPLIPTDSKPWSKMSLTDTSSGSLEQSSGISLSSSGISYANAEPVDVGDKVQDALRKAFPNISPLSPLTTNPLEEFKTDSLLSAPYKPCSSGSSGIDNKTYSIVIPVSQDEVMADCSEVQTQAEMPCDPAYYSSDSETANCPDQQVPLLPVSPSMASPVLTDMSYQHCNVDSGRFSDAEESSLSSISSGTNTATSCESSDDVVTKLHSEKVSTPVGLPSLGRVPAQRFLAVDDDYQAFQNVVEQPAVSLTEQNSGGKHLDNYQEELSSKTPQDILSPVVPGTMNDARSLIGLPNPFFFMSKGAAERSIPVITDSGYQSV